MNPFTARSGNTGSAIVLCLALWPCASLGCEAEGSVDELERTPHTDPSTPHAPELVPATEGTDGNAGVPQPTDLRDSPRAPETEPGPNPDLEVAVEDMRDASVIAPEVPPTGEGGTASPTSSAIDSGAESPSSNESRDAGEPTAAPTCDEALDAFAEARDHATEISEYYDCRVREDCANIHPCDRTDNCGFRVILNVTARQNFEDRITAELCDCFDDRFSGCSEPDPPPPSCLEGVCYPGAPGEDALVPETCEEHASAFSRLTAEFGTFSDGTGCQVIAVGNGCTGGECRYFPVGSHNAERYRAMLEAHLRFNDCSECGDPIDCSDVPPVVEDGSRCVLGQ